MRGNLMLQYPAYERLLFTVPLLSHLFVALIVQVELCNVEFKS